MSKSGNKVKETKEERELAKIGAKRFEVYRELYAPQIDRYISKVRKDDNDRSYARAEAGSAMSSAYAQMERNAVAGANPQVAANRSAMFNPQFAMSQATQFNDIDATITDMHYRGLDSVAKMGQGIQASAVQGLTDVAADAHGDAVHNAFAAEQRRAQNIQGAMSLAGAGASIYGAMPAKSPGLEIGQMPQHIPGNPTVTPAGTSPFNSGDYFDFNAGGIYGSYS